ncbi:MAG: acetyl esterase [Marinoscillum sp.]
MDLICESRGVDKIVNLGVMRYISVLMCVLVAGTSFAQMGQLDITSKAIEYKTIDTISLNLHCYLPTDFDSSKVYNSILFFHGGGWNEGEHTKFKRQCKYFASRGLISFSAEYRVKNRHGTTPFDATEDVHDAFQYLVDHHQDLNIDKEKIVVAGGSAGGQLAASTSFWNTGDVLPIAQILFNPVLDTGPDGFANHRMEGRYLELSPIDNLKPTHGPTLIMVGTEDYVLPVDQAKDYKTRLEKEGVRCDLILYEGQKHSFFNGKPYFEETLIDMDLFLALLGLLEGKPTIQSVLNR